MPEFVSTKRASQVTGLHPNTLRKYADEGIIPSYRLPNGDRRFDVSAYTGSPTSIICYARVSQRKQKEDLQRQKEYLLQHYPGAEIISDTGSGINFKRKGLRSLLDRLLQGHKLKIVVTYRDRLARFGFDAIEYLVTKNGGEIVVLNQISTSPTEELTRDLTAIITVFSSRLHGLSSHTLKKSITKADKTAEGDVTAVDGGV